MRSVWPFARIAASALGFAAIAAQLALTLSIALQATTEWGAHLPTVGVNFFSFFTILSNLSAAVALAIAAIWAWAAGRDAKAEPRWLAVLLACVTTYMITTGIVYNLLLRGIELPQGSTVPWSNEVLHVVFPLFLLADALFAPLRRALSWRTLGTIAAFPIAWAVYTLVRANLVVAPATGADYWYPYPFLDPHLTPGGYLGVAGYIVGIAAAIVCVGAGLIWLARRRAASSAASGRRSAPA
ncbi:Pr6Pr family membrane protein [Microbacterium sp. ARD32]|uniref:Pr6Pr family membrane protein n=1 Tax=Microbacterium sp. ARD32 TaxID=2962577 RepID=UPI00288233F3|nr:Pr6Pr family membrane protein [Microbacterium sp. ARD32]MDT0157716.1 Pr6Pr family membrane protein [Microbacterium sp. ARD32]